MKRRWHCNSGFSDSVAETGSRPHSAVVPAITRYGRVAAAGAASDAWFGLFLTFFVVSPNVLLYALAAVGIGAGFGILFGIVSYAVTRRTQDYTSMHQMLAGTYEVIVDPSVTQTAQKG